MRRMTRHFLWIGLALAVTASARELEPLGILGWDGVRYTRFWIDPREELVVVFMAQSQGS